MNLETEPTAALKTESAVLGGGCFWCLEAIYRRLPGILSVTPGYAGGHTPHPTYEQVCTGTTGYAEVIRIEFDPLRVSYTEILALFWQAHDPTTRDRQEPDQGPQYRSIILYQNEEQRRIAEKSRDDAQSSLPVPIVTEIVPLREFYPAEASHCQFYEKHPRLPYCQNIILPKLRKLTSSLSPDRW